jgi:sterol desaturase/sphingolipid hydroxylase (fatty acid hydroxylase superfamily)
MNAPLRDWLLRSRPFLVYPAVIGAVLVLVVARGSIGWGGILLVVLIGLLAWTLVEWLLHRAMHVPTRWEALARFQDQAHLGHHRAPRDIEHSVVNLSGSIPLAVLFFGLELAAFRDLDRALAFQAGLMAGYVWYEFVHLASHGAWHLPVLRGLARYHALHHYQDWNRTFGVTTPLWDWVFGTLPQPGVSSSRPQPTGGPTP